MKIPSNEAHFFNKLARYCAYQERSVREVLTKLAQLECPVEWRQRIVDNLQAHNFLNEKRFVEAYVSGKQSLKAWGKAKIKQKLLEKGFDKTAANQIIAQLDNEKYLGRLETILSKKHGLLARQKKDNMRQRLVQFALQKGYTYPEIETALKQLNLPEGE
jgi:regulatory protein